MDIDKNSGPVPTTEVTAAHEHDVTMTSKFLHGEEETVNGDSGYLGAEKRADAIIRNKKNRNSRYRVNRRPSQYKKNFKQSQVQSNSGSGFV